MRQVIVAALLLTGFPLLAQKDIPPTDGFSVTGRVKNELKFTLADLSQFTTHKVNDVLITNHLGEPRGTAKGLQGILMKDILSKAEFDAEAPRVLSEYYITFIASDGFKVVFLWNEIFNTATGDNLYLITEKDGKKIAEMKERSLVISTTDFKTGRRNIKGLSGIIVERTK